MNKIPDLSGAEFRKSSFSGAHDNCVEVATNLPGLIAVRDSKDSAGPVLTFSSAAWSDFLAGVRNGDL
ncbi:transcriptional regulator [Streptosporangium violaceochromogenes]|nr:transcriptional regulator [Streptosporangium violaceochromogenes]